jgi:hypothetical protein
MNTHVTVSDTHTIVSDIHRNMLNGQEGSDDEHRSVRDTCILFIAE